jgi:non-specific serine/threonine protein kinase
VAAARALLRDQAFAAAWAEGRTVTLEEAIALALAQPEPAPAALANGPTVAKPADPLTGREREVAALIARGFSNRQIAEELVIAERTVHAHVGNILGKLGFPSRAQVAAWAVEQGLLTARPG